MFEIFQPCTQGRQALVLVAVIKSAERFVGLPLVTNPDLALRPDVAARILKVGMEEGWFTGRKLADYLPRAGRATLAQYTAARRIINGQDCAQAIAALALDFEAALVAGGWRVAP